MSTPIPAPYAPQFRQRVELDKIGEQSHVTMTQYEHNPHQVEVLYFDRVAMKDVREVFTFAGHDAAKDGFLILLSILGR